MKLRLLAVAVPLALAAFAAPVGAEDLLQIYREAQQHDPSLAAARANWSATQERVPQARAGLLPNVGASGSATANDGRTSLHGDSRSIVANNYGNAGFTISASQPLYRQANVVALDQARRQVEQADFTLASSQQELMIRVTVAYFDVLLAEVNVELSVAQKAAVSEQLAQARRNFEVGVATITDTNEAQARYDSIVAQEISARNDLDNRRVALRAIIGRMPGDLKKLGPSFEPTLPEPNVLDHWLDRALTDNLNVRIAGYTFDVASLEIDRARAGHLPTVDLVASAGQSWGSGSLSNDFRSDSRSVQIGVALNVPIYQGGFVDSRVREAISLQESSRQNLEVARRNALANTQVGFAGVNSAVASVKAFEQALRSAQTALESNRLGQEVGVRTNLDVLNVTQQLFQTRRDLAQAYFNYLISVLRLKASVGSLTEQDIEDINRRLGG
ncbi:MAG TPA: TolC family outer membrane protein [Casimicrobiaceae bacterium]|nr:TolC family outer membrane protein [Casimicrobiaceae bacterium]